MRERKREGGHGGTPFNGPDCSASQMHNREDQSANGTIIASHWANYTLWAKSQPPHLPLPRTHHTHPSVKMVNKANKAQGRHGKAVNTELLCLSPVRAQLSSLLLPSLLLSPSLSPPLSFPLSVSVSLSVYVCVTWQDVDTFYLGHKRRKVHCLDCLLCVQGTIQV